MLRREVKRLRQRADRPEGVTFTDDPAFIDLVSELNDRFPGTLPVFAANDFGWPVPLRPEGTPKRLQEDVRRTTLEEKYETSPE